MIDTVKSIVIMIATMDGSPPSNLILLGVPPQVLALLYTQTQNIAHLWALTLPVNRVFDPPEGVKNDNII